MMHELQRVMAAKAVVYEGEQRRTLQAPPENTLKDFSG